MQKDNIKINGHIGTWYVIDETEWKGEKVFLVKLQMNADFQQSEFLTLPLKIILESLRESIERNITLNKITG